METPTILHQTWKTKQIPNFSKDKVESWNKCNFEYRLYDDQDIDSFVQENTPQFYSKFKSFQKQIERVDFWRYAVLYHVGGIYADLDMEFIGTPKQIKKYLKMNKIVLGYEPPEHAKPNHPKLICNAFMISPPKQQYWLDLMQYICDHYSINQTVLENTGPLAVTKHYQTLSKDVKENIIITEPHVFYPMTYGHTSKTLIKNGKKYPYISQSIQSLDETIAIHHWTNTWDYGSKTQLIPNIIKFINAYKFLIIGLIILIGLGIYYFKLI